VTLLFANGQYDVEVETVKTQQTRTWDRNYKEGSGESR